jgi:L-ornithine Nalpha-acyltransferase
VVKVSATMFLFCEETQKLGDAGGSGIRIGGDRTVGDFLQCACKPDLAGLVSVLARSGSLEARLAGTKKDVRRAQRLRYRVFFEEGGAIPNPTARRLRRDVCHFDSVCDHLLVVDKALRASDGSQRLVGVYRLLRQEVAESNFGFYSSSEFDVDSLIARHPSTRLLEVGRVCVEPTHRRKHVLELLWRGIWAYASHHKIDALIGCASLPGANAADHIDAICALAAGGDQSWRASPRPECAGMLAPCVAPPIINAGRLLRALPPIVKGYWRLGATFSAVPAIDRAFGVTDLFVAVPLRNVERRYLRHFARAA